jgi:hypothetical protein
MDHSRISEVQRDFEAEFKSLEDQLKELAPVCHTVFWPAISKPLTSVQKKEGNINTYIPNEDLE